MNKGFGIAALVFAILAIALSPVRAETLYRKVHSGAHCNETYYAYITGRPFQSGMLMWIEVIEWMQLIDTDFLTKVLNAAFQENLAHCRGRSGGRGAPLAAVVVMRGGSNVLIAWMSAAEKRWNISFDQVQMRIQREDAAEAARKAQLAREQARQEAERQAREARLAAEAKAAAEKEKRRQRAAADCGAAISIPGGPWFSSTYRIAALDEAKRALHARVFFCIKAVEYVSPAPNPFGGKAARARFVGYGGWDFEPKVQIRDFFY